MKYLTIPLRIMLTVLLITGVLALIFGGPADVAPMASINDPFKELDYSGLPATSRFAARDGAQLAYRAYAPAGGSAKGSVVLVHGSSASSNSMHFMAKGFAAAGFATYALDVRGHGESGSKGHIAYIGQLEDDLEDFVRATQPAQPATLAGFSSGGGFVLRFAGTARQTLFANYLLLSPFISQDAPNYKPNSGGWVSVGLPRYIAIAVLNAAGVHAFNHLTVTKFALSDQAKPFLTPQYSFALAQNFRPLSDYRANIRAAGQPMRVVAGVDDESFYTAQLDGLFEAEGKTVPVTLLPGIGHIPLTLEPAAIQAAVAAVGSLQLPIASTANQAGKP